MAPFTVSVVAYSASNKYTNVKLGLGNNPIKIILRYNNSTSLFHSIVDTMMTHLHLHTLVNVIHQSQVDCAAI